MPKTRINGVDLFYELKGEGQEVVAFLNGIMMSTASWVLQIPQFVKDYQVLLHDFRGQGNSTLTEESITFDDHVQDFKELLDELQIDKIHIVGVSYGAEVAIHFALAYPDMVKTLVLGTATSESKALLKGMVEAWISAAETHNGELLLKVISPMIYSSFYYDQNYSLINRRIKYLAPTFGEDWFEAFQRLGKNFLSLGISERLEELDFPTLILAGRDDILKPPFYSELLHSRIKGSTLLFIENAGHAIFIEKPEQFNQTILDFFSTQNNR